MKKQKRFVSAKEDFAFKELMKNAVIREQFLADVLQIPVEEIQSTRLLDTFLWKRYRSQKLGILDVLVKLADGTKVNIELQLLPMRDWDKRAVFYLAKVFTEDLYRGEKYEKAVRVISISILDFNLTDREEYHCVYRLRDKQGRDFSDILELHTVELRKRLEGKEPLDDWVRLFNAKTEEELCKMKTKNAGVLEAVKELRTMSLSRTLRAWHESRLKYERDKQAILDYARDEGIKQGEERGMEAGQQKKLIALVCKKLAKGQSPEEIAEALEESVDVISPICEAAKAFAPGYDAERIYEAMQSRKES